MLNPYSTIGKTRYAHSSIEDDGVIESSISTITASVINKKQPSSISKKYKTYSFIRRTIRRP